MTPLFRSAPPCKGALCTNHATVMTPEGPACDHCCPEAYYPRRVSVVRVLSEVDRVLEETRPGEAST